MADNAQDLQQLISLSQAMLRKAREQLWDDVIVLETERRELIQLFFSGSPILQDQSEAVAAGIQLILSIDNEIMELGAVKRFDILQILHDMDQGKKAVKAYTS